MAAATVTTAMVGLGPVAASAAPVSGQSFSAYGSGAAVITKALQLGATSVANAEAAFSGGAVNSRGLNAPVTNEFGINVAPAASGFNAVGRGTGLEAGLLTSNPQQTTLNQLLLTGLAGAAAPPPSGLVTKEIPVNLNPVVFASVLRGQAQATYDPTFCPVGRPITYGLGYASNLQLLNAGGGSSSQTGFASPTVGTSITAFGTPRGASQSRTVTYLVANGDGTFGVASETRQTVAPVSLLANQALGTAITLEVAGELGLRVVATGKPGGSSVSYLGNPVLTVTATTLGVTTPVLGPITLEQALGQGGLALQVPGLATVGVATPPRALNGALNSRPALATDGTSASGAVDTVRLNLLGLPGLTALDLALGHMEGAVSVPAGGLRCDIPVAKSATVDPVTAGSDFAFKISIPTDTGQFAALFNCDLVNITAVDVVSRQSGSPSVQLLSADRGGVVNGNTVTWANLGSYQRGAPPIVLTINARVPASSGAGVLRDTVDVRASLGNCRGGATGEDIVLGGARLNTATLTGTTTLIGPNVTRGQGMAPELAATGGSSWPLAAGGGMLLAFLGLARLRRRVQGAAAPS